MVLFFKPWNFILQLLRDKNTGQLDSSRKWNEPHVISL